MVLVGDTLKDIEAYIYFRQKHLLFQRRAVPFNTEAKHRSQAIKKLDAKIDELKSVLRVIRGNIKERSKTEYKRMIAAQQKYIYGKEE